ncbi:MAG: hypothetical protein CL840_11760 [Crocinitomicaceae bacterium]|nr:hypothetical protein [Crocinitomicaceae bacterium]|tara:strand:+ start:2761 stop:4509 length:1749 start_codon:yes stop_codon:yes gene_type:complete
MKVNNLFLALIILIASSSLQAQRGTGDSLKSGDVFIIKEYEPRIADAFKLSDVPKMLDTVIEIDNNLPFEIKSKKAMTSFSPEPIKPAKMKGEPLNKLYKAYALVGIGNYLSTRAELVVNNTRSRKWDYGFSAYHHGSAGKVKDRGYSGFSDNNFNLYGKKFFYNKIASGQLKYDLNSLHKYGFDPVSISNTQVLNDSLGKKNTAQNYQNIEPGLRFKTYFKDSSEFNYDIKFNYYHYWDKYKSSEDNLKLSATVDRYFNTEFGQVEAWIDVNSFKYDRSDVARKESSTIFGIAPSVITGKDAWKLKIGADVVFSNGGRHNFYFYPNLYLKYDLVKDILIPYAGANGQLKRNNFKSLTQINPFIVSDPTTGTENTKFNIYGGIRGELASDVSFNISAAFKNVEDLALFINKPDTVGGFAIDNEFNVRYDDVKITTLAAEIGYQRIRDFSFLLKGEYFIYSLTNQKAAWHLPDFKLSFNGRYNIGEKMTLTADLFFIGERVARTTNPVGTANLGGGVYGQKLDPLFDLNIGVEYFFSPRWTAFVRFYNMTNSRYAIYNEYYQQGFTVMAGMTYKFWQAKKGKR